MPTPGCNSMKGWPAGAPCAAGTGNAECILSSLLPRVSGGSVDVLTLVMCDELGQRNTSVFCWLHLHGSWTRQGPSKLQAFLEFRT